MFISITPLMCNHIMKNFFTGYENANVAEKGF